MQKIQISHPSDAGQRIDRFCKKYFPNIALGAIYKMLRTGKIKVNGKKKDQTYKLEQDDEISLWISDEEIAGLRNDPITKVKGVQAGQTVDLNILYEDEYLMVVNKPPGINVHAGDHKTEESNLIDQVQDYLAGRYDSLTFRPALVHRIDRDTSGCILIAKSKNSLEALLILLQSHRIEKVYHAIVFGNPTKPRDTIEAKLLRIENARDEAKVRVDDDGQSAVTHYQTIQEKCISEEGNINISLLECRIETGRTHQIRVHMAHIGCPIIADKAYGDKKLNSYIARTYGISRQLLHARALVFEHPITKKALHIEAPYHSDYIQLLGS